MVTSPYRRNILEWAIKQQTNKQTTSQSICLLGGVWLVFGGVLFAGGGGAHRCVQVMCSWSIDTGLLGKSWMYERAVSYKSSYHDIDIYSIPLTFKEILRLTSPQVLR